MHHPLCFSIALKDHELSRLLLNECIESGKKYNWLVQPWEAVNGNLITNETWKSIGVTPLLDRYNMKAPGVQGCFISHFSLWCKSIELNEPIVILEHDALIHKPWDDNLLKSDKLIKFTPFRPKKGYREDPDSGVWTTGLIAYLIKPIHAKRAVDFCRRVGALPADVVIGSNVVDFEHLPDNFMTMNSKMNDKTKSTTNFL